MMGFAALNPSYAAPDILSPSQAYLPVTCLEHGVPLQ